MPTFIINTNALGDSVNNSDFLAEASALVASELGKPESYVMVHLNTNQTMCFGGTEAPCAFCRIISLGSIGGDKNKTISAAVCSLLERKLGVPPNRTYIEFTDPKRSDFGFNSSTFG
ncbi:unnamed protein product [Pedinophyceae sp. YPF-701]|nr:unnamed protein product [Pedinophyceae sp. YPF-701]